MCAWQNRIAKRVKVPNVVTYSVIAVGWLEIEGPANCPDPPEDDDLVPEPGRKAELNR